MPIRLPRWLALGIVLAGCGTKEDNPRLDFSDVGFALYLPKAMQQALDSLAPGFRYVRSAEYRADVREAAAAEGGGTAQALFAVVGDFDGDGKQDVALEGASPRDSALAVIAILNADKPQAVQVVRFPQYDASAVGIYLSRPVRPMLGAFEVVNYPDATTVYMYRDGKFTGVPASGGS